MRFALPLGFLALTCLSHAAEPTPLELALIGPKQLARLELALEVDGVPVPAIWDETFKKLVTYFDRNGDGHLDTAEAKLLPSVRSLRHALGNGFTPPVGEAPAFADLDMNRDGKVTTAEGAAYYRTQGLGHGVIGIGKLPHSASLTAALCKSLDTNNDGVVNEKEWQAAATVLAKLDQNDDELIGAGELVPKALYPGASGTILLTPPSAEPPTAFVTQFPVLLLPNDRAAGPWTQQLAERTTQKADALFAWRTRAADARWTFKLTESLTATKHTFALEQQQFVGWVAHGQSSEAVASAKKQILAPPDMAPDGDAGQGRRRRSSGNAWLLPTADRNNDGQLDSKEFDAWFDLQTQLARGQVLVTILANGGLFELLDTNHDGALSLRELRQAWSRLKEAKALTGDVFDPKQTPTVVSFIVSHGYPRSLALPAQQGPTWFRAMDRNNDGDVSQREFTGPPDVFTNLDTDKDGLLSADEAAKVPAKK